MNNEYIVRNEDGSIDINGSVNKFATAISTLSQSEVTSDEIQVAVDNVCDNHVGKRIPMQALVALATTELDPEPANLNAVSKRVHAWIRATAKNTGRFEIVKGVGGGVARLARDGEELPVKTGT